MPRHDGKSSAGISTPESLLSKKFGFDATQAQRVYEALNKSGEYVGALNRMALHIKGMGFLRSEIVEIVEILGENSLDKANWVAVGGLKKYTKTIEIAFQAYKAGLTVEDVKNMSEEQLSMKNLEVMTNLKNF